MSIEAMKQMVEAWDDYDGGTLDHPLSSAMENLRTAIEQAEKQEPVAWGMPRSDGLILDIIAPEEHESYEGEYTIPLYTTPPAAPVQEPKFVRMVDGVPCITLAEHKHLIATNQAAAQRQWVGLSETDLATCDTEEYGTARYWERVLREKNNL